MSVKESTVQLLAGVVADVRDLAGGHLAQMQREVSAEISGLKTFLRQWLIIAACLLVGMMLTGLALAHALVAGLGWPLWAGLLLVGVVAFAIARRRWSLGLAHAANVDLVPAVSARAAAAQAKDIVQQASDALGGD